MEPLLSIDCCTEWTSLGLLSGGRVLGEMNVAMGRRQSTMLPLLVQQFLEAFELTPQDISLFAVTHGPGSFTGIKVGIAFTQFLAWGLGKEVVPLSSLEAMAFAHIRREETAVVLVKAGGGRVFSAAYREEAGDGLLTCVLPAKAYDPEELLGKLRTTDGKILRFLSPSPEKVSPLFSGGEPLSIERGLPRGGDTVRLASLRKDCAVSPFEVRGEYLKEPSIG